MSKLKTSIKTISLLVMMLICANLQSLPASSFIIVPAGINSSVYTESRTVYKVESSDEDFLLQDTANQKILSLKTVNGKSIVLVSAGESSISTVKDLNKYIKNTPYLNTDKESIKRAASKFKNSKNSVRDVSLFVYKHIYDKKIGMPLLSAESVLSGRAGDCTEHSILTISLLRTLQIPSRAVMGIILSEKFSGKQNVFVYHMWVEAYQKGKWIVVDSTRPDNIYPNRYIALAYHNLMTETPMEYLSAISTIQDMHISVVK